MPCVAAYGNDIDNIDSWVGAMAEDHLPGQSLGPLASTIIKEQFIRTRDGDRLFYRSNDAGLYTGGVLNASIASLVNLNTIKLSDVIELNAAVGSLQDNLFFASLPGDFNYDGAVDAADLGMWRSQFGTTGAACDANHDGRVDGDDLVIWQQQFEGGAANAFVAAMGVPEPGTASLIFALAATLFIVALRGRGGRSIRRQQIVHIGANLTRVRVPLV